MMKLSPPLSALVAAFALFCMLFMQMAAASYHCPMVTMLSQPQSLQASAPMVMSSCEGMDSEMPTLCHVHAEGDLALQALDKAELPAIAPFLLTTLAGLLHPVNPELTIVKLLDISIDLTRTTSPPAAIRHCCFRL